MDISVITAFFEDRPLGIVLQSLTYIVAVHLVSIMIRRLWHNYEQHVENVITSVVNRELCKEYNNILNKLCYPEDTKTNPTVYKADATETSSKKRKSFAINEPACSSISMFHGRDTWLGQCQSITLETPSDTFPPTPLAVCSQNKHRPSLLQSETQCSRPQQSGFSPENDHSENRLAHDIIDFVDCWRQMMMSDAERETIVNCCYHELRARVWFTGHASKQKIQPCLFCLYTNRDMQEVCSGPNVP
jgi:hypothetical protein